MFTRAKKPTLLDEAVDRLLLDLERQSIGSEEYDKTLELLSKLQKMRADEKPAPISKDTMLTVGANLLGIMMIIGYEHQHVLTSRALNMLQKPKY